MGQVENQQRTESPAFIWNGVHRVWGVLLSTIHPEILFAEGCEIHKIIPRSLSHSTIGMSSQPLGAGPGIFPWNIPREEVWEPPTKLSVMSRNFDV